MFYQETIRFIFLVLCFLNKRFLSETLVLKFFINFLKYLIVALLKSSYYYIKFVFFLFAIYKAIFVTNFLPSLVQVMIIVNYSFNFIWDGYLLLLIYSTVFWFFPYYLYKFSNEKLLKISVNHEVDMLIVFSFIYFSPSEKIISCLVNLYSFDLLMRNRKIFLNENAYLLQSRNSTQKALQELASFVRDNYDSSVLNLKAKNR